MFLIIHIIEDLYEIQKKRKIDREKAKKKKKRKKNVLCVLFPFSKENWLFMDNILTNREKNYLVYTQNTIVFSLDLRKHAKLMF